jgi:hypothetical protein
VQHLSEQMKSARSKMVSKAKKCGILLDKERKALESAVKDYFNQKFSCFADGYQEQAIAKTAMMTNLFCNCYKTASKLLGEKMVAFYQDDHDNNSYTYLKELHLLKELDGAVVAFHSSDHYLDYKADDLADIWSTYKVIMEAKSTMLEKEQDSVKSLLQDKLSKSEDLRKLKDDYMAWCRDHGNISNEPQSTATVTASEKQSEKSSREQSSSKRSTNVWSTPVPLTSDSYNQSRSQDKTMTTPPHNPDTSESEGFLVVQTFIKDTVDIIVEMILTPSPIVPSIELKQFDGRYVRIDASQISSDLRRKDLIGKKIEKWYAPVLLAPFAGTTTVRVFEKGCVQV